MQQKLRSSSRTGFVSLHALPILIIKFAALQVVLSLARFGGKEESPDSIEQRILLRAGLLLRQDEKVPQKITTIADGKGENVR